MCWARTANSPAYISSQASGSISRKPPIPRTRQQLRAGEYPARHLDRCARNLVSEIDHAPTFTAASIIPFTIAPPNTPIQFSEVHLEVASQFRTPAGDIPNVTQAMVDNPNVVLAAGIAGKNIVRTTTFKISTTDLNPPSSGGGSANIAFLQGAAGGPNAQSVKVDATFWIETIKEPNGSTRLQLQYTQSVLLNFNNLSWPHVSVATLIKQ